MDSVTPGQALKKRCEMLEKTQWADEFIWREIEVFAKYLEVSEVTKGMPVFSEGDSDAFMCIIVEGRVKVVKEDRKSSRKEIAVIREGKTFGEMSLFDSEPRSATVIADEHTTMLVLTRDNLDRLIDDYSFIGAKLLFKLGKFISQRLRMTTGKLVDYL